MDVWGAMGTLLIFAAREEDKSGIDKDEYAWLEEIDTPDDLYMRNGTYTGPRIEKWFTSVNALSSIEDLRADSDGCASEMKITHQPFYPPYSHNLWILVL